MLNYTQILILFITITTIQSLNIVYLENCTYSMDFYKEYLNLLWSSNDSRILHIQAVYSLSSNKSLIPGHIYTHSYQSVALIPFFVQCKSYKNSTYYLPFTQCSSTMTNFYLKKNYESTRTNLYLKNILSLTNVPILYIGEYNLILSNCSFKINSTIYQMKSNELFSFHIEYESAVSTNCYSCNRRTSICHKKTCQCRSGTIPIELNSNRNYCVDITRNCTLDRQRCLYSKTFDHDYAKQLMILLILLIGFVLILFLSLLWCLLRNHTDIYGEKSITTIDEFNRTPSTMSTTDSIKINSDNSYPKIIGEQNNGEIVFILV